MSKDKTNIEEITPKEIYLQAFTDDGLSYKDAGEEVTWCEDKVSDEDIKYIREDQVQAESEKYLDGLKMERKSVTQLKFYMGDAYNDLGVQVAFKEGFNSAVDEFNTKLEQYKLERKDNE